MKLIIIPALFVSLFAFHPAYAVGAYDLQCMLDNGEQMTLSHVSNTVYISFENPGGDSEESGSVIKLDIPSGEAKQILAANPGAGTASFTLRGENEDIEGAVAVNYSEYDGTGDAYYTVMNAMGQETSTKYHASRVPLRFPEASFRMALMALVASRLINLILSATAGTTIYDTTV